MAPKIHITTPRKANSPLVYEVVRSQRKSLSRYKFKKQTSLAEQILFDVQVMGG